MLPGTFSEDMSLFGEFFPWSTLSISFSDELVGNSQVSRFCLRSVTWNLKLNPWLLRVFFKRYRRNPISTRNSSFSFIFEKTNISLKLICVVDFFGEIMLSYAKKDHDIAAHRHPLLTNQYPAWDWILLQRRWLYGIVDVQRFLRNSTGGLQSRLPKFHIEPENGTLETGDSFWKPSFSDSMLIFRGVSQDSSWDPTWNPVRFHFQMRETLPISN